MGNEYSLSDVNLSQHPWPLLIEVTRATPAGSWVLTGGMMVHLHALRARVEPVRPTSDVDVLLDLEATASRVSDVAGALQTIGFQPVGSGALFHRFTRDVDIVDVMVATTSGSARWSQRPIVRVSGGSFALENPDTYFVASKGERIGIRVPNISAAIAMKGAAYRDDQRDRDRHLEDLIVLLAADDRADLNDCYSLIPRSQKAGLRPALKQLEDPGHPAWIIVDSHEQALARHAFDALSTTL